MDVLETSRILPINSNTVAMLTRFMSLFRGLEDERDQVNVHFPLSLYKLNYNKDN